MYWKREKIKFLEASNGDPIKIKTDLTVKHVVSRSPQKTNLNFQPAATSCQYFFIEFYCALRTRPAAPFCFGRRAGSEIFIVSLARPTLARDFLVFAGVFIISRSFFRFQAICELDFGFIGLGNCWGCWLVVCLLMYFLLFVLEREKVKILSKSKSFIFVVLCGLS